MQLVWIVTKIKDCLDWNNDQREIDQKLENEIEVLKIGLWK